MDIKLITDSQKPQYNKLVSHVVQSVEWGEFKKSLGTPTLRYGIYQNGKLTEAFQITFHKIPLTKKYVGYLPKGPFPNQALAQSLKKIAQENGCAFIKIEPNVIVNNSTPTLDPKFIISPKPLFTKYNFLLDLTQPEDVLQKNMHPKTRYNIKIAQKHGVKVEERVDDEAFETYLKLYFETTKRQKFYGHNENYHRLAWNQLKKAGMARLLIAYYKLPTTNSKLPLAAWMLLNFKDTLYYPYGGSSLDYKQVMAPTLLAWEAIKLGKRLKLKALDLWGALPPDSSISHPWFGFSSFKEKLGAKRVEYIGSLDLVFDKPLYKLFTAIDSSTNLKVFLLGLIKR